LLRQQNRGDVASFDYLSINDAPHNNRVKFDRSATNNMMSLMCTSIFSCPAVVIVTGLPLQLTPECLYL